MKTALFVLVVTLLAGVRAEATFSVQNFSATPAGASEADLGWSANMDGQTVWFEVQRSVDGVTFGTAGTVDARPGQASYSFVDENATGRVVYYRLLSVLNDGSEQYSRVVAIIRTSPVTGILVEKW